MLKSCLVAAVVLLSGCAGTNEWSRQDTVLQSLVTASYAIDAIQTSEIQYHDDIHEAGFASHFVGNQPSTADTWQYFATVAFTSYVISYYLPPKWRPYWQGAQLAVQTSVIISNCSIGLGRICHED